MNSNNSSVQFETFYHLTDRSKFALNPKQVPQDNAMSIRQRTSPGLFLTKSPESWVNGHGYLRPFVAEVQIPAGAARQERWGDEMFLPAERFHEATVSRVIPIDAHVRETWGAPGWVEEHHGTTFDTKEPLPTPGLNAGPSAHYPFRGYKYEGPDVRDMSKEEIVEHKRRVRAAKRSR